MLQPSGKKTKAVWCWSATPDPARADLTSARRALAHTFGPVRSHRAATPGDAPVMLVRAPHPALGWAVATWLVTHAASYGIHDVRYAGFQWRESSGSRGWTLDKDRARPDVVRAS